MQTYDTIWIMAFSEEVYLDYFDFEKPLEKKTEIITKFRYYDGYFKTGFQGVSRDHIQINA